MSFSCDILKQNQILRKVTSLLLCFLLICNFSLSTFSSVVYAAPGINKQVGYQGFLKDSAGVAVPNGTYNMVFNIYSVASGGSPLWTGNYTGANGNPITVTNGFFHVLLGSGTGNTMTVDFTQDEYYLGITAGTDAEMTPRHRVGAVPQAFNADTLDGLDSGVLFQNNGNSLGGLATLGTNDANGLVFETNNTSRFTISAGSASLIGNGNTVIDVANDANTLTLGHATQTGDITIGVATGLQTVNVGAGTGVTTINVGNFGSTVNSVNIANNPSVLGSFLALGSTSGGGVTTVNSGSSGLFLETASGGAIDIGSQNNPTGALTIAGGTGAQAVNIAAGAGAKTVTIGNTTGATALVFNNGTGGTTMNLTDNDTDQLDIQQGSNNYLNINTINGSENISFGNITTDPAYAFLGTGALSLGGDSAVSSGLRFLEASGNGTNYVGLAAPSVIAANVLWTLPNADGTSGQVLSTDGSGGLSWTTTTGGVSSIGTIDSQTKSANGAVIAGNALVLQTADAANPGLVSTTTQTFAGDKTFTNNLSVNGNTVLGDAASDTVTITGTNVATPNNLNIDANTLFVDAANNRVGVGTATPSDTLGVFGTFGVAADLPNPGLDAGAGTVDLTTVPGETIISYTGTGSTTFTPPTGVTSVQVLVVGGGGGGGAGETHDFGGAGGGGAGGGVIENTSFAVTPGTPVTITVGAGGSGSTLLTSNGTNGSGSAFDTISVVGGGGGGSDALNGSSGGSGGGAGGDGTTGGTGTAGQGNNGGASNSRSGGGGGGASAAGGTPTATTGANGGVGLASSISGTSQVYGSGAGGGTSNSATDAPGGSGGTNAGSGGTANEGTGPTSPSNGSANFGGGGGGGRADFQQAEGAGGNGGSGVVIVRFTSTTAPGDVLTTDSAGNVAIANLASGSILFAGSGGVVSEDKTALFWDDTNDRFGVGVNTPQSALHVSLSQDQTSGGVVTDIGSDKVRAFSSSGTLVVKAPVTVQYLIVGAGGGGGGDSNATGSSGAGGGAGGVLTGSISLAPGTYPIVVGSGGTAGAGGGGKGGNGGGSSFNSLSAIGGGGGGGGTAGLRDGSNGGSGGGAASAGVTSGTPGTGTAGQGNNGGSGVNSMGGGGGGAGAVGGNAVPNFAGNGGNGLASSVTGTSVTYGGGGGGGQGCGGCSNGSGGTGGGGNAGTPGSAGTNGLGGGGGGGSATNGAGGAGGSGVIIIRYTSSGGTAAIFEDRVGIGTDNPNRELQIIGDVRVGNSGTNGCIENFAGAALTGSCASDINLKTNINVLENVLPRLSEIQAIAFTWNEDAAQLYQKDTQTVNYGLVAQQLEELFPELVTTNTDGYKQVDYSALNIFTLASLTELNEKVDIHGLQIKKVAGLVGLTQEDLDAIAREYQEARDTTQEERLAKLEEDLKTVKESTTSAEQTTEIAESVKQEASDEANALLLSNTSLEELEQRGALSTYQNITVQGESIFEKLATFIGDVLFKGRITYEDRDVAGEAEILSGDTEVTVTFERAYSVKPLVNATIVDAQGYTGIYSVHALNEKGFTIRLEKTHGKNVLLNWSATAVKGVKRFQSSGGNVVEGPTPTAQPTSTTGNVIEIEKTSVETKSDTITPSPTPSPTPLPTQTTEATPASSPTPTVAPSASPAPASTIENEQESEKTE